jgi:hypothetical protein
MLYQLATFCYDFSSHRAKFTRISKIKNCVPLSAQQLNELRENRTIRIQKSNQFQWQPKFTNV